MPGGSARRFGYDARGRLQSIQALSSDPDLPNAQYTIGWTEWRAYDPAGNVQSVEWRDANGVAWSKWSADYDHEHRLKKSYHPDRANVAATWNYDPSGVPTDFTDEESRLTELLPDPAGRPKTVRQKGMRNGAMASIATATYERDAETGVVVGVTDGASRETSYVIDDFGSVVSVDAPAVFKSSPFRYQRDARGNAIRRTGGSVTIDWTYDGLDRITKVVATNSSDSRTTTYVYVYDTPGKLGRLDQVYEVNGRSTTYTYDALGRVRTERITEPGVPTPFVTEWIRDADGDLDTLVYPSGLRIKYVRDPATKDVTEVRNDLTGFKYGRDVTHWPAGPLKTLTFGNDLSLSQTFNLRYEPATIQSGPVSLGYDLTATGNPRTVIDGAVSRSFTYDFLDRLETFSPGHGSDLSPSRYVYSGGRVREAWSVASPSVRKYGYGYDEQTNLTAVTTYAADGTTPVSTWCYVHDALNRLVTVGGSATSVAPDALGCRKDGDLNVALARFRYDHLNRRVGRWVVTQSPQSMSFAFDQDGSHLSELTWTGSSWSPKRDYVWLDGRPLAQIEYPTPAGSPLYFHLDHIGLPRAVTNQSGTVVSTLEPRPYGDVKETGIATNLRLPGQYDELLFPYGSPGPYYNWNRWYLPAVGRYMELDPIALHGGFNATFGPNWYGYAEGNPLRFTDPLGLDAEMCYRRFSPIFLMPYARHCFVRFNGDDKDTMSYDNSRVGPDQGFGWLSRTCTKTSGQQNDACIKREMGKCDPKQYDFTGFNCCHCVEQAFNSCGLSVPVDSWPNWPVNPGPQPGEQGSCAKGPPSNACSERR